jgi:murein L,D-transpeptidase YcbB/YkuD
VALLHLRADILRAPLPVYLGYWTARMSADGLLQFRDDVYALDGASELQITSSL